ncbi:hypothetical protein [Streptomyces sp. BPTC-684]|uniref:hypothetical protein n=1 Tax=Streptomyces sp. BPTC-684 TaxID=3043734 RepID=UPI0024B0E63C|nr:hypothetical protein [Streptomyces sp. BPTC-684]WHM37541.1 hypothetical protein QIY60_11910 [Streptomyces sp. BPTC-684]
MSLELTAADKLLKEKAHYSGPYKSVTLRWPLFPGMNEPYYIFNTPDFGHYFVGVYSQQVKHTV